MREPIRESQASTGAKSRRRLLFALATATLALGPLVSACQPKTDSPEEAALEAPPVTLNVRGVIRQLPQAAGEALLIQHESIPGFIDISGQPAPMDSMTMPFAIADGVLTDDIAAGDKVFFELRVDWQATPAIEILSLAVLPADTVLEFEASEESESPHH